MKIDELHDKLFELLCVVDDICREENVRYFLDSGTELGAVREHDFIPWDDDMDIKVLAEDYPRFKEAMEKRLPSYMHIVEADVFFPYFYDFIVRIYDDRWLLRDENDDDKSYCNYQNRVGTDVFIFSKVPKNKLLQKINIVKIKILYGMAMNYRSSLDMAKYSFVDKLKVKILCFWGKFAKIEKIYKKWKKMTLNPSCSETNCGGYIPANFPPNDLKVFPKEIFDDDAEGIIRGRRFPIPAGYDRELTINYGNYMMPPKDRSVFNQHLSKEDLMSEEEFERLKNDYQS